MSHLWWSHARWPLLLFIALALTLGLGDWDSSIARHLFFDAPQGQWRASHNFWANSVIHVGGRWAIRGFVLGLFTVWLLASWTPTLQPWRRPAGYACLAMVLAIALVGLLKVITNVDCPWDLEMFGGHLPYVSLFADRPDGLPRGECFPAAHASSGYALVACHFALRERYLRAARCSAVMGILVGLLFGVAQQARGAHFLSHDVWSAFLVWMTALSLYVCAFRATLWESRNANPPASAPH